MTQNDFIAQMTPKLKERFFAFETLMGEAGIKFRLNEVLRSRIRQLAYVCQGRTLDEVEDMLLKHNWRNSLKRVKALAGEGESIQQICDIFRSEAGIYLLNGSEWYKVTWTLNSKHFALPDGLSGAFDIKLLRNGDVTYDTKWDDDKDGIPEYLEAARLGVKAGLDAGGLWKKPDYPHFQLGA